MEKNITVLVERIQKYKKSDNTPLLIAIDGRCGSGKTTLSTYLSLMFQHSMVIHMDDFYLPKPLKTTTRLKIPGGNVHYERFLEEILLPLTEGRPFVYNKYSCITQEISSTTIHDLPPLIFIEGSYALHPTLNNYYDLKIFLTVDDEVQLKRITARNGLEKALDFKNIWIPLEELYFATFDPYTLCDFVFNTRNWF